MNRCPIELDHLGENFEELIFIQFPESKFLIENSKARFFLDPR